MQEIHQLSDGACAMADAVFHIFTQFCESKSIILGDKYGVVAEASVAASFGSDGAFHHAMEEMGFAILDESDDCAEASRAVIGSLQIIKQLIYVCLRVMARACITSCMDTRRTAQRSDFKSCVVGKTIVAEMLLNILSLLQRITL